LEALAWARSGARPLNEVLDDEYWQGPRGTHKQKLKIFIMTETHGQKKGAPMFSEPAFGAQTDF